MGYPAGRLGRGHGLSVRRLRHEPARGHGSFACGRLCGIVCVWLVMGWPIPLLVDTRPLEKLFPLFERPSLKQRAIAAAGMAGVAFAVLALIGILFLPES